MSDGYKGYYVSVTNNQPTEYYASISETTGYQDTLYYPHKSKWNECYGYWLASPSAVSDSSIMNINCSGYIYYAESATADYAARPVVCLPSSVFK